MISRLAPGIPETIASVDSSRERGATGFTFPWTISSISGAPESALIAFLLYFQTTSTIFVETQPTTKPVATAPIHDRRLGCEDSFFIVKSYTLYHYTAYFVLVIFHIFYQEQHRRYRPGLGSQ